VRIAVIGAGLIGTRRAETAVACGDHVTIVADVDRDRAGICAARVHARATDDWRVAVTSADVDVVVVATPNKFAQAIATTAASAGKHVLCEKPLGRNAAEAGTIVEAAERAGITLKTGFNHRHHPAIRRAHELISSGTIGEAFCFRCVYGHGGRPGYDKEWRGDPEIAGGGELLDQGVHVLDLARWFLGEFVTASAIVTTWYWDVAPLEDNAFATLQTASGQVASFHTSWTQWKNRFLLEIIARDGLVTIDGLGGSYGVERLQVARRRPESGPPDVVTEEFVGDDESWREEWIEFTSAIRAGRSPLGNGRDGLEALRLVDTLYLAARERRPVTVLHTQCETK